MKSVLTVLMVGAGIAFVAAHIIWYISPSEDVKTTDDLQLRLVDEQPTIVKFYSNL